MTTARLQPGHCLPLCASCAHRGSDLSHPNPCGRMRWEGHRHVKPALSIDGDGVVTCGDFPRKSALPPSLKGTSGRSAG
jgi:hypothetical protein